jgi:hypothetical protein
VPPCRVVAIAPTICGERVPRAPQDGFKGSRAPKSKSAR